VVRLMHHTRQLCTSAGLPCAPLLRLAVLHHHPLPPLTSPDITLFPPSPPSQALDRFKASSEAVLVASDVAARGLDVRGVDCVIHYQLPASADTYIHRSGRTGRAEAAGTRLLGCMALLRWCCDACTGGRQTQ
jgi:hypothetical protein